MGNISPRLEVGNRMRFGVYFPALSLPWLLPSVKGHGVSQTPLTRELPSLVSSNCSFLLPFEPTLSTASCCSYLWGLEAFPVGFHKSYPIFKYVFAQHFLHIMPLKQVTPSWKDPEWYMWLLWRRDVDTLHTYGA